MNILFLTLIRIDDINESGIYNDLMRKFKEEGHQLYIVSPNERRFKEKTNCIDFKGIKLLKIRTLNITKTNLIEKGIGILLLEFQYLFGIKKYYKGVKFDLLLYSTPPITYSKIINFIKKRDRCNTYLLLKDIFPQNAVDLKLIKENGLIHKYFRRKEKNLYAISDYIGCMSPANTNYLIANNKYIIPANVEVNPNSIKPLVINTSNEEKIEFRKQYKIPIEATIFIYGGNLGKPQGIDFMLEIFKEVINCSEYFFIIAGSGTEFEYINNWILLNNPTNIVLLDALNRTEYSKMLTYCDVGLVFLNPKFTIPNYPSRILTYLNASLPIIFAIDSSSDAGKIATQNNYGFECINGNKNDFLFIMKKLHDEPELRKQMGLSGYKYLYSYYSIDVTYNKIMSHFNAL